MTDEEATVAAEGEEVEETAEGNETANATDPAEDTLPGLLIGIQAIWGTLVWLVTLFLYIKTNSTDPDLDPALPFAWFWSNLGSSTAGWMAAMYMSFFFAYLAVSVVELVAWILFKMGNPGLALLWVPLVGFWGSLILYAFPFVFALLHIILKTTGGGLDGTSTAAYYTNDLILGLIIGGVSWITHGLLHVLFTARFVAHAKTFLEAECVCTGEAPEELAEDADDEAKEAYAAAVKEYEAACEEELAKCEAEKAAAKKEGEEGEGKEEGEEETAEGDDASEGDNWEG